MDKDEPVLALVALFFMGFVVAMSSILLTSHVISKKYWTCTKMSQPKEIGEEVQCLQYTRSGE